MAQHSKQLPAQDVDAHSEHKPSETRAQPFAGYSATDHATHKYATDGDAEDGEQKGPVDIYMADVAHEADQRIDGNDKQRGADRHADGNPYQ